jgi:hypothetical protein
VKRGLLDLNMRPHRRALHGSTDVGNVFTVMGVTYLLHVKCAVNYKWKFSTRYIQCYNTNCKGSACIKVNKVHVLLSCISKDPVMHACEERHDLIHLSSSVEVENRWSLSSTVI